MLTRGERVALRPLQPADFGKLVEWADDDDVNRYLDADYPQTVEQCKQWYEDILSDRHRQTFAVVLAESEELVGDVELDHITWRSGDAELRIRIGDKGRWNKGLGTDAVLALLKYGFDKLNLKRIYLRVFIANRAAIRCYEKAGFRKEGRLRRKSEATGYDEIYLMRILKEEYHAKPTRIRKVG